jgi:hypothetical protein
VVFSRKYAVFDDESIAVNALFLLILIKDIDLELCEGIFDTKNSSFDRF